MTISYRVKSANQIVLRDVVPGAQAQTTLTIAAGVVVPTTGSHLIDTEAAAASDNLDTITLTNLRPGDAFELTPVSAARVTIVKNGTGNITTTNGQDILMNTLVKTVRFKVDSSGTGVVASLIGVSIDENATAFADGDTTPDISAASVFKTANTGATTITNFDGGVNGDKIEVHFEDANTTIQHGASIKCRFATDIAGLQYDTASFRLIGSVWRQL